jgi:hypothetical protein
MLTTLIKNVTAPYKKTPTAGPPKRLIVDLSYDGVNIETLKLALHEAMQFGRALDRLLNRIRHADPAYGPV